MRNCRFGPTSSWVGRKHAAHRSATDVRRWATSDLLRPHRHIFCEFDWHAVRGLQARPKPLSFQPSVIESGSHAVSHNVSLEVGILRKTAIRIICGKTEEGRDSQYGTGFASHNWGPWRLSP